MRPAGRFGVNAILKAVSRSINMYDGDQANLASLNGRRIAVGVCAGIASYKVCSVVAPLVFQSLAGRPVLTSAWESANPADPQHIRAASALDAFLIAPCTMDMLAKLASGQCDDMVSLLAASIDRTKTKVLVAPSMNEAMWRQPATQRNLVTLRADGFIILEPATGWQACRAVGAGRLPEPDALVDALASSLRA